ncbi:MAG: amidohydrolase, partial [Pseudomonadota bacterium]
GDFAVLDRDYFAVTDAEIAKLKAELTVLGGEVVHGSGAFATQDLRHIPPVSPAWSPVILQGTAL